jgi:hypothetical protein
MQTYPPGTRIGQYEIASLPRIGERGVVYFALDHGNDGRPKNLSTRISPRPRRTRLFLAGRYCLVVGRFRKRVVWSDSF